MKKFERLRFKRVHRLGLKDGWWCESLELAFFFRLQCKWSCKSLCFVDWGIELKSWRRGWHVRDFGQKLEKKIDLDMLDGREAEKHSSWMKIFILTCILSETAMIIQKTLTAMEKAVDFLWRYKMWIYYWPDDGWWLWTLVCSSYFYKVEIKRPRLFSRVNRL